MNDQSAYSTANWMVFVELGPMAARAVGSETESAKQRVVAICLTSFTSPHVFF